MTTINRILIVLTMVICTSPYFGCQAPDTVCGINAASELELESGRIKPVGDNLTILVCRGDFITLETLLKEGASPDSIDGMGLTPLAWAARCGQMKIVKMLIKFNADINKEITYEINSYYKTRQSSALLWAARGGQKNIIELLIKNGANVKVQELIYEQKENGEMGSFVKPGNLLVDVLNSDQIIEYVLKKGAPPDGDPQNTKLMQAAMDGNFSLCKILVKYKANKKLINEKGLSARELAAKYHPSEKKLQKLLE